MTETALPAKNAKPEFPLREAHHLVRDLMTPNPKIYWADFLFSVSLAWTAFLFTLSSSFFSLSQTVSCIVAVLAFYRSAIFVHELAHLKRGTFKVFRMIWNLVCGIPMMIPSFMYDGVHNEHHKPDTYGTPLDGEYLPFASRKPREMLVYVFMSTILPALLLVRFLVLTPLSYLMPSLRKIVWERASSLTIDPSYKRAKDAIRSDTNWQRQEIATCFFATLVLGLVVFKVLPIKVLVFWYLVVFAVLLINSIRTLAAHAYANPTEDKMTFTEQYLDSVNVPGNSLITPLWAPLGLRYHATHHLFMSMPYHNLGEAQRRLVSGLADNTLYLKTSRTSLWDALTRIWRNASS